MANSENRPDRPDFERKEYRDGAPARALCHALMLGTTGVRALGEAALPRWPAEKPKHYAIRANVAQVARYYQRTVQAMVGMILASPPTLADDADQIIKDDCEDLDGKGTHLEVAARQYTDDAINGGFMAILIDAPPVPDGLELNLAEEQALGLRPFWVNVSADQIISWIVDAPDWKKLLEDYQAGVLTTEQVKAYAKQTITRQVVIHEPTDVVAGEYGCVTAQRYRRLRLTDSGVTFTVFEHKEAKGDQGERFDVVAEGMMRYAGRVPFREIPLAVIYSGRKRAAFVAEPPVLGLAELNLDHYQVTTDRRYLMRLCHSPTLAIFDDDPQAERDEETGQIVRQAIEVGPNSLIRGTKGGDAKYVVAPSDALMSSKEEREDLVRQMATLGMSFLGKDRRASQETATGRELDDAAENATHATVARGLQDGLEQALKFHAMYRGVKPPSITVNTTYASPNVDPQIGALLWQAVAAGQLDMESFLEYIQSGDLPEDVAERVDLMRVAKAQAENAATLDQIQQEKDAKAAAGKKAPDSQLAA